MVGAAVSVGMLVKPVATVPVSTPAGAGPHTPGSYAA